METDAVVLIKRNGLYERAGANFDVERGKIWLFLSGEETGMPRRRCPSRRRGCARCGGVRVRAGGERPAAHYRGRLRTLTWPPRSGI
jgi:hypothetical protein